jgi:hypothetical protein
MLPMVSLPPTLQKNLQPYRAVFCRTAGFAQVSRYLAGLLLSPNKTLQGIHAQWVWPQGERVERRSMHASVFESSGLGLRDLNATTSPGGGLQPTGDAGEPC